MTKYLITPLYIIIISLLASCGAPSAGNDKEPENGQERDYLSVLKDLAEQQPGNAAIFNEMALYYLSQGDLNEALRNVNKSMELEPGNTDFYVTLSDIYLMMGDPQRAQLTLYKAMDMEPEKASIYVNLGRLQIFMEDYPRAFENLRKAIELDRNNSYAYFWRGVGWLERGDTLQAIADWQVAVANNPESFDGYFQLGMLMAERNDRFALDYLDHARRLAPPDPELLYDIGMAFQEIERFNKAFETYEQILALDSCFYKAWFNMGYINLVEFEEFNASVEYFSHALRCKSDYTSAAYNRGLAYEMMNDIPSARKDYQLALRLETNYERAIESLNRLDRAISE